MKEKVLQQCLHWLNSRNLSKSLQYLYSNSIHRVPTKSAKADENLDGPGVYHSGKRSFLKAKRHLIFRYITQTQSRVEMVRESF